MSGGRNDFENLKIGKRKPDALTSKDLRFILPRRQFLSPWQPLSDLRITHASIKNHSEKNPKSIIAHLRASQSVIHFGCACTGLAGGFLMEYEEVINDR